MRHFRDLTTWRKAHELTLLVYASSATFPRDERFGLVSQMRRASAAIAANIAEGAAYSNTKEFLRFLRIARASAMELEYHCLLARDLGWLDEKTYGTLCARVEEVRRMLTGLISKTGN